MLSWLVGWWVSIAMLSWLVLVGCQYAYSWLAGGLVGGACTTHTTHTTPHTPAGSCYRMMMLILMLVARTN